MTINVHWDVAERPLTDAEVVRAITAALAHGGRAGLAVDAILVSDTTLAELHGRFLGDPSVTDVMAFDLGDEDPGPAAEIYASVDRARSVAEARGLQHARELTLYLVHGALHLCGHDDHEPAERAAMRAAEREVMLQLGFEPDTQPHDE